MSTSTAHQFFLGVFSLLIAFNAMAESASPKVVTTAADLDTANCLVYESGRLIEPQPPSEMMEVLLGIKAGAATDSWETPVLAGEFRHFRIAFKKPVMAGTLCTEYAGADAVAVLKPDAPYPGDVNDDAQWTALPFGSVKLLPEGVAVRALRFTHRVHNQAWEEGRHASSLRCALLLEGRYWNPAQLGSAVWQKSAKGEIEQWLAHWPAPLQIAGIVLASQPGKEATLSLPPADGETHPAALDASAWKDDLGIRCPTGGPSILSMPQTLTTTRGLRLNLTNWKRSAQNTFAIMPLVALKAGEPAPRSFVPPLPFTFAYDMPFDGFPAIRFADADGMDVRRLIAEVPRTKGTVSEGWDLKDDDGNYVKPGKYTWRGITRAPLKLTYENTVYTAGNPPWRAPVPGGGWWMADHAPPCAVTAVKDIVFLGAGGAEFGIPLIATDLDGKKIWHADIGTMRLTSDGRFAYVVNDDKIVRIDPANKFEAKTVHQFKYSVEVPGHARDYIPTDRSGVACRDGLMVVSYNGREPDWITSELKGGDMDLNRSFPPPGNKKVHETAYSPPEAMHAALLVATSSQQAGWGPAVVKGPLANTLVLQLRREVPVGTLMLPRGDIRVYALRPGKQLPGMFDPVAQGPSRNDTGESFDLAGDIDLRFDIDSWVELKTEGQGNKPTLAVPPQGLKSRTLVFTSPKLEKLDGCLVLNRRYHDAAQEAELIVLEGSKTPTGGWKTSRSKANPISYGDAPTAGLVWKKPTPLRGFAIMEPMMRSGVAVDVWTGPDDALITSEAFKEDANWRQVYLHQQMKNHIKMNWHYHRVIHGDFGETITIRALRIRIVEPPNMDAPQSGGFGSIIAFQPLGKGDPELPATYARRLTLLQLPDAADEKPEAKVLRHLSMDQPGALCFDGKGALYASSERGIVRITDIRNQKDSVTSEVVIPRAQLKRPRGLVFDAAGLLYVLDRDTCAVQVFDPATGIHVKTIGTPGGSKLGPWDPTQFAEPSAMGMDSAGKLWVVEQTFQPKRISRWTTDGVFEKDFMGPTHYGGGGVMDAGDRSVVNHLGMKFRMDWKSKSWKLESRLYGYGSRGMYAPDRAVYVKEHRYLMGDRQGVTPFGDSGPTVTICEEQDGIAQPIVAAGLLSGWRAFGSNAEALKAFSTLNADATSFVWVDLNRDHIAQPSEVQLKDGKHFQSCAAIGNDLSLNFQGDERTGGWRLRIKELRPDGLPIYDMAKLENVKELTNAAWVTASGETFVMGHKLLDSSGKVLWRYPDKYMSVQASNQTPWGFYSRPAGVLAGGLRPIGTIKIGEEELFCVIGNNGDQYAFTHDGLLASAVLGGPEGYGRRFFSMPDCEPGKTDMSDLRNTVETFHGHICRADDGNVYTIAGKNHISVLRVDGLDKMQRISGTVEVANEDLRKAMAWTEAKSRAEQALRQPAIAIVPFMKKKPVIDGDITTDWPGGAPLLIRKSLDVQQRIREQWTTQLAFDEEHLYISAHGYGTTPMLNNADDRQMLFQGGDAFDLNLGLDPKADPKRTEAASGDIRLVLALVKSQPAAMLYRYRVPESNAAGRTFTSPVGQEKVDEIRDITSSIQMRILRQGGENNQGSWTLEAAIPWKTLGGQDIIKNTVLRGDVGTLVADPNGVATSVRYYWANKTHVVLSDQPSEARILPALWGEFRFVLPDLDALGDDLLKSIK